MLRFTGKLPFQLHLNFGLSFRSNLSLKIFGYVSPMRCRWQAEWKALVFVFDLLGRVLSVTGHSPMAGLEGRRQ
jgi:hypothetical protein